MNVKSVLGLAHRKLFANATLKTRQRQHSPRLVVENLEERAVPATLPAPEIDQTSFHSVGGGFAPVTVANPLLPNNLVTAYTDGAQLQLRFSTDGGDTWSPVDSDPSVFMPNIDPFDNGADPKASNPDVPSWVRYTNVGQPSVVFDRFNNFFVANTETNADATSGRIVVRKFSFNGTPVSIDLNPNDNLDIQPGDLLQFGMVDIERAQVLYKWMDGDEAYNLNIAVNNNRPTTDPLTVDPDTSLTLAQRTVTDPFASTQTAANTVKVVVSWNTRDVYGAVNPGNGRQAVSNNGGTTFGAPVDMTDLLDSTSPEVIFTPGRAGDAGTGGVMVTTYVTTGGTIMSDTLALTAANAPKVVEGINNQTVAITDALPPLPNTDPDQPQITYYNVDVPTGSGITQISHISVGMALYHNDLEHVKIRLIKRSNTSNTILASITLVENKIDAFGDTRFGDPGISGTTLGLVKRTQLSNGVRVGTWFSDTAQHSITAASGTFSGVFTPESLNTMDNAFGSLAANQIDSGGQTGKWQIEITDFRTGAPDPTAIIRWARLQINQNFDDRIGGDVVAGGGNGGSFTGTAYPTASAAVSTGAGVGPHISLAVDTSMGAYSQFQNRLYMAYNAGGAVQVKYSDNRGTTWSGATTVGSGFNPAIAVDPSTGTVIVTYYSTIYDPAGVRTVTMMATSVNATAFESLGSIEFSTPTPINPRDQTYDQIRSKTLDVEAIPTNGPATNNGVIGFGNSMGLTAFGGRVTTVYTGNLNTTGSELRSQLITIAAGPRVVDGDMGAILDEAQVRRRIWSNVQHQAVFDNTPAGLVTYNNTFAADGRRQFTGFVVEFDRPIDPSTFTAGDIRVVKRRPSDDPSAVPSGSQIVPVTGIVALDDYRDPTNDTTLYGSKRFLVNVAPQTDVATYSYAIGSDIKDRIRGENFNLIDVGAPNNGGTFNNNTITPIPDDDGFNPGFVQSGITVGAPLNGQVVNTITVRVNITHPAVDQLSLVLRAPNGNLVPLIVAGATPNGSGITGANLTNTVFDDAATNIITNDVAPYTGTYQVFAPDQAALSDLFGAQATGTWRLLIQDDVQNFTGTLNSWGITLTTLQPQLQTATGNFVDQNGNAFENQGDADSFAIPKPTGATPFVLPYVVGSVPISIPGPRLIDSKVPGQVATEDNLVSNAKVSAIDVQFDRTMSAATFTPADIIRITGPLGDIPTTSVTVTPITAFDGTATGADSRFFRITFPEQKLSGNYHIQFSSKIAQATTQPLTEGGAAVAIELDTNANAGLGTLSGASAGAAVITKNYGGVIASPVAIAANTVTVVPLNVNEAYQVLRGTVEISLTHTNTRDLDIRLISPNGTTVLLASNAPANGSDDFGFTNTTFDDAAATPIQLGAGGFANGFYNPIQPLAQLIGVGSGGTWKLSITNKGSVLGTVNKFKLNLDAPQLGTGLGESVGDQTPVSFRIFNASGSSLDAKGNWTPVGPAQANDTNTTGRTSAIAVDPTDPSGNIVYAAGASGGVWKTTNFLTRDPAGPTWIPLTDFGPTNAINIGAISLFNTTGDPNDTVVLVGTGSEDLNRIDKLSPTQVLGTATPNEYRYDGVGFLISYNGGKNWNVYDSTNNYDATLQKHRPVTDALRDHVFVGATVKKVFFEKNPNTFTSLPIMYAVVGRGSAGNAAEGLWRSMDGGRNWSRLWNSATAQQEISDFVLSEGSALASSGFRPTTGYLAVEGQNGGVFRTTNLDTASPAFIQLAGGLGRPTINTGTISTSAPTDVPLNTKGRIVLAVPSFVSNDPLANAYYRNWVFAAVVTPLGFFDGIYVSKDAALGNTVNWTKIKLTGSVGPDGKTFGFDDNGADTDFTDVILDANGNRIWGGGGHSMSLATDPNDPNILYFGSDRLMRIDITQMIDPYNLWMYSNTNNDGGLIRSSTDGSVNSGGGAGGLVATNPNTGRGSTTPGDGGGHQFSINQNPRGVWNFVNLVKNPYNPFSTNTALNVTNFSNFNNTGGNVTWTIPDTSRSQAGNSLGQPLTEAGRDFDWISNIITIRDPFTGKARVLYTSDESIRTFVSNNDGTLNEIQGFNQPNSLLSNRIYSAFEENTVARKDNYQIEGSRNGNIQVGRLYSGEAQPSLLAASIAQTYLVAATHRRDDAFIAPENTLSLGNDDWLDVGRSGPANYVAADQTGSGNIYILRRINDMLRVQDDPVDFFQISINGNQPISFTNGLFRNGNDSQGLGQWDNTVRRFAVNPVDKYGVLLGSAEGRLYRTDGSLSFNWQVVAEPAQLDGSYTTALAFGAPDPLAINLNNHIYAGTEDGSIFVTAVGGGAGNWVDISAGLDGSDVMKIVPNPTRGSHEAYAVTKEGVYHIEDWTSTDPLKNTWENITSNLLTLTVKGFGSSEWEVPFLNNQAGAIAKLTSIAVDWRPLTAPIPGVPVLYVAGDGGVVRSTDAGATWARFTDAAQNAASPGGGLPVVKVSDIDLSLGNIDPNTGRTLPAGSPDVLVATTLGRGMWALPLGKPQGISGPRVESATPTTPQDTTFNKVTLKFDSYIDVTTFTTADIVITAPDGSIVPVTTLVDTTNPPPGQANLHNEWEINFANQSQEGVYTITVGPSITDAGGTLMNQNANNINGEPTDYFQLQVVFGRNDIADLIKDSYLNLLSPRNSSGTIITATQRIPTTTEFIAASTPLEKARLNALLFEAQRLLVTDEARQRLVERLFTIGGGAVNEIGNLLPSATTTVPSYWVAQGITTFAQLRDFLVNRLKTGKTTPQGIIAEIMATDEYVLSAGVVGGPAQAYLTKVYQDLFAGTVPGSGIQFSMLPAATQQAQILNTGSFTQRLQMIRGLVYGAAVKYDHDANPATALLTNDFRRHIIRLAFAKYVNRLPTTTEINASLAKLNTLGSAVLPSGIEYLYRNVFATQSYFNLQTQKLENQPGVGPFPDTGLHTNRAWVDSVFEDRYFRGADANGFFSTTGERDLSVQRILDTAAFKTARLKFVRGLLYGTEFRTLKANESFQLALGRNALPTEITTFLNQMKLSTQNLDTRLASIFASTEFYNNASALGGSSGTTPNERFVKALYQRLLNRQPTPAELSARLLNLSAGRYSVALRLIRGQFADTGPVYRTSQITKYYNDLLGRAPTPAELTSGLTFMNTNRLESLLQNVMMSRGYHEIDR